MTRDKRLIFGVDAGTLAVKVAVGEGAHTRLYKLEHQGEPLKAFEGLLEQLEVSPAGFYGLTCGRYGSLLAARFPLMEVTSLDAMMHEFSCMDYGEVHHMIDIGSSGLALAEVHEGKLQRYETNSLCAAGTGAFLDQQMYRLGLDYDSAAQIDIIENPPSIASRCSVFAKSDLIHRQQEGYTVPQLWNGLVKGLAQSAFSTLFRGTVIQNDILLSGGLANNKVFIHYLEKLLDGHKLILPTTPHFFIAKGLCAMAPQKIKENKKPAEKTNKKKPQAFEKPLEFHQLPQKEHVHYTDENESEIDVYKLDNGEKLTGYAGVDIGSTSTKMALLDQKGNIRFGVYTRTRGRPIKAFQRLLGSVQQLCEKYGVELTIGGLGTTGSGRKLAGTFAGADMVKNEISAHLKGAVKSFPNVRTIFEIGGQDSKYISVENGWMKDANMNYVCAAGTGSFLEEQALNLNIPLADISEICRNAKPPIANHRCTVFMEQDANQLLTRGISRNQVMASILYAVCKNYLNRVVQNRPVEEPILFLGATARNAGLVEAFQNILGKEIHTSTYSHIMGAVGMAELCRQTVKGKSRFKGFWLKDVDFRLKESTCKLCDNQCRITSIPGDNDKPLASWGYQCGREHGDEKMRKQTAINLFLEMPKILDSPQEPNGQTGKMFYPKVLNYYSYTPLWRQFFAELGIELVSGGAHADRYAHKYSLTDTCYPFKRGVGKVISGLKEYDYPVFMPAHIQDTHNPKAPKSYFCPLAQAFPSVIKSTLNLNGKDSGRILAPVIDLTLDPRENIHQLYSLLKTRYGFSRKQIARAWHKGTEAWRSSKEVIARKGRSFPALNGGVSKPAFVVMGRSYNLMDSTLSQGIPRALARYGYDVIPMDMLPVDRLQMPDDYEDMYWAYGQTIVVAARYINQQPGLYPVFLTNFNCGPDSFLLNVFEKELKDKPSLILELDEHGGDGGYMTRLEAFFDRVEHHFGQGQKPIKGEREMNGLRIANGLFGHKVYIPPMHPAGARLMSAGLRAFGVDAVALEKEDTQTFAIANACVRGSECMPAASTIGSFIHQIRKEQQNGQLNGQAALFMPCADGPCRFGQYARLHEKVLKKEKINARIISPNSDDNYGDISGPMRKHLFKALMIADILDKLRCRIRPYVENREHFDQLMNSYISRLEKTLEENQNLVTVLKKLNAELNKLTIRQENKPLVGVVGEIYVRNSPFSNGYVLDKIEENGGEAWVSPLMEWLHYTAKYETNNNLWEAITSKVTNTYVSYMEKKYMDIFKSFIGTRREPSVTTLKSYGRSYVPDALEGESILTIGRTIAFFRQGAHMVINLSPFGCMPGNISASILKELSVKYQRPTVSLFYDGEADFSEILKTYINNIRIEQ